MNLFYVNNKSMCFHFTGHAGRYMKAVIFFTVLNTLAQFSFQLTLLSYQPYASLVSPPCKLLLILELNMLYYYLAYNYLLWLTQSLNLKNC